MPPRLLYRLFPLAGRASRALEERLTGGGRLLAALLVAGAILGIDASETAALELAILALALLGAALLGALFWRPRLTVARILPTVVTAGQPASYWLCVTNHGARTERDLLVVDELVTPPLSWREFRARRDVGDGGADNWFDRAVGFPRWLVLRRRARGADLAPLAVPAIAPGATVRLRVPLTSLRRGWLRFARVRVMRPDPLGLARARHAIAAPDSLLALPRRHAVQRPVFPAERRYQPGGVSLALAVGDAQEFAALRDYRPGDPRRHIHWRSFARTGNLIVKQYQDEYFDRHALIVDCQLGPGSEALQDGVIEVAASLVGGLHARDAILDLLIAGTTVVNFSSGRGLGDDLRALALLAELGPGASDDFAPVTALLRERLPQLASVVVVLGRDDAPRRALLAELAQCGVASASLTVTTDPLVAPPVRSGRHCAAHVRLDSLAADLAALAWPR